MAVISETELQRRLRNLESASSSSASGNVSDDDPTNGNYTEGETWYNAVTGNLWLFSNGVWQIAPDALYIRYATSVVNVGVNHKVTTQSDVTGFSIEAFLTDGSQKLWRGLWWGAGVASTDPTDYEWFDVTDTTDNQLERYWANASARLTEVGDPDKPGPGVTWTLAGVGGVPSGAYWIAERFKAGDVWTPWTIYPVQADNLGIPFIKYTKTGFNMPVLGSATWITDVVEAASVQTGVVFSNQKELGYGTVVVIQYDNGKVAGQYIRQSGVDVWVAPSQLIDGDVIVDGSLTADHLQANTIGASKIIVSGVDSVTFDTVGADAFGSAATVQSVAAADATAKANLAEVTASAHADGIVTVEEARAIADATAKANAAYNNSVNFTAAWSAYNADVTALSTALDTTRVNGIASTTIISAGKIGTGLVIANSILGANIGGTVSAYSSGWITTVTAFPTVISYYNSNSLGSVTYSNILPKSVDVIVTVNGRSGASGTFTSASQTWGIFVGTTKHYDYGWSPAGEDAKSMAITTTIPASTSMTFEVRACKSSSGATIGGSFNIAVLGILG